MKDLDFRTTLVENPKRVEFNRLWQAFLASVQPGDTVAVFFSGHGVQVGGLNYLLPRDVPKLGATDEGLLRDESIALQRLLDDVKSRSAPKVSAWASAAVSAPSASGRRPWRSARSPTSASRFQAAFSAQPERTAKKATTASGRRHFTIRMIANCRRPRPALRFYASEIIEQIGGSAPLEMAEALQTLRTL